MTKSQEKMIACLKEMRTDFSKNGYINKPWDYATAHHTNRAIQTFLVKLNIIEKINKNKWKWTSNFSIGKITDLVIKESRDYSSKYQKTKREKINKESNVDQHSFDQGVTDIDSIKERLKESIKIYQELPDYLSDEQKGNLAIEISSAKFD